MEFRHDECGDGQQHRVGHGSVGWDFDDHCDCEHVVYNGNGDSNADRAIAISTSHKIRVCSGIAV